MHERRGPIRAWERFWFAEAPVTGLAFFRILFAVCLALEVENTYRRSVFAVSGGFHLPYLPLLGPVDAPVYRALHTLQYPLLLLLALGVLTRVACWGLVLLQGTVFFADQLNFRNHPYFFILVLALLGLSCAGDALSVPSSRRGADAFLGRTRPVTIQRLVQFQVSLVYVCAALHKLHPAFFRGEVMTYYVSGTLEETPLWAALRALTGPGTQETARVFFHDPRHLAVPAALSVALELGLPFALWTPRLRRFAIVLGLFFHASIAILMNIREFSLAMVSSYVLFVDPAALRSALERFAARVRPGRTLARGHR